MKRRRFIQKFGWLGAGFGLIPACTMTSADIKPNKTFKAENYFGEWKTQGGLPVFDYLIDQEESLELLIENKFDRILCSGSINNSEQGLKNLINLKIIADNKISIMPGGGVNLKNFNLFKNSNFTEIHLSAIDKNISIHSNYDIIKEIVEMSKQ